MQIKTASPFTKLSLIQTSGSIPASLIPRNAQPVCTDVCIGAPILIEDTPTFAFYYVPSTMRRNMFRWHVVSTLSQWGNIRAL